MPEDLVKFGMIPEFIGRLPVITSVHNLDREALLQILVEPRNALVKQYQRLFELDGVELEFDRPALEAIADQAILRGTGARGLRAIMEEVLMSVMYEVPVPQGRGPRRDHRGGRPLQRQPDPGAAHPRRRGERAARRAPDGTARRTAERARSGSGEPPALLRVRLSGADADLPRGSLAVVGAAVLVGDRRPRRAAGARSADVARSSGAAAVWPHRPIVMPDGAGIAPGA